MNTALEYSTRVVQEGGRRCKKSTLNDLVHLTPLRIPLMNPPIEVHAFCCRFILLQLTPLPDIAVYSLTLSFFSLWGIKPLMQDDGRGGGTEQTKNDSINAWGSSKIFLFFLLIVSSLQYEVCVYVSTLHTMHIII
jgi:hypothetical protein